MNKDYSDTYQIVWRRPPASHAKCSPVTDSEAYSVSTMVSAEQRQSLLEVAGAGFKM